MILAALELVGRDIVDHMPYYDQNETKARIRQIVQAVELEEAMVSGRTESQPTARTDLTAQFDRERVRATHPEAIETLEAAEKKLGNIQTVAGEVRSAMETAARAGRRMDPKK